MLRPPFLLPAFVLLSGLAGAQGLPPVPVPSGNPITPEKVQLGKALFWEEQLSSDRTVSCGTCHMPGSGGGDPRSGINPGFDGRIGTPDDIVGSPGVVRCEADGSMQASLTFGLRPQITGRRAPSMINAAFAPELFWDGRATGIFVDPLDGSVVLSDNAALESQAAGPPASDVEMGHIGRDWQDIADRIATVHPLALASSIPAPLDAWIAGRPYPELFNDAFGTADVTPARIAMAIATYERTLISDQTPFDDFAAGNPNALGPLEAQGLAIFNGQGRCSLCHTGPLFTDDQYHNVGLRPIIEDEGRFGVTANPAQLGAFRTPGLRNVGLKSGFFHTGAMATLEEVVEFYDQGGEFAPGRSPLMQPLGLLPQQKDALVAFLRNGLTDPRVAAEAPPFDRPSLYSESKSRPTVYGFSSADSNGYEPHMVALQPPQLGNPAFTIGLDSAHGGGNVWFGVDVAPNVIGKPFFGGTLHLANSPNALYTDLGILGGAAPGEGFSSLVFSIPNQAVLLGGILYGQWFVVEPGGHPLTASEAVQVILY